MSGTTTRALALLNLLQTHTHWPGPELAARLRVTERTVRRDVERLRELGYRIDSAPGGAGGYRLEAGAAIPPLLLSDDEAVAMAVGLRLAASRRLLQGADTAITALAKLEQVLPAPLRRRVNALADAVHAGAVRSGAPVSSTVLGELALACRDHERIRFRHTSASGAVTRRRVEPHTLAPADRHWYLVCWDLDRDDWRTFRVDRIEEIERTRVLVEPRTLEPEEIDALVLVATSWSPQRIEASALIGLPLHQLEDAFGPWAQGSEVVDDERTRWPVGGSDFREVMYALSWIPTGIDYRVALPDEARDEMRETLTRMLHALAPD
ncbi:MAG: helix-turn-helix transcriptional regulator [Microbacterium sp.]